MDEIRKLSVYTLSLKGRSFVGHSPSSQSLNTTLGGLFRSVRETISFGYFKIGEKFGLGSTEESMLSYSILFLVVALIAAIFGFTGIAAASAGIAKLLFVLFLALFLVSLVAGRRAI